MSPAPPEPPPAGRPRLVVAVLCALATVAACATVRADESDRIAEVLALGPGSRVADVGAGSGGYAFEMAARVGEEGHVFATEVDAEDVAGMEERVAADGLTNLSVVLGVEEDTGLEPLCCDAILLRLVYHHFTRPEPMRASLLSALKPGGLIAVIDMLPNSGWRELPGVPDRGGHGIPPEDLIAEMVAGGFELVERIDDWPGDEDHFCVLFRRPG